MAERFRVSGRVIETETGRPLPDLIVRAFDRDLVFDDKLGSASTDADGLFEIRFTERDFRDLRESRPDLYLRVYDRSGQRLLLDTSTRVRVNAQRSETFDIEIPGAALQPRRGPNAAC